MSTALDPKAVRKAAALIEKLDGLFDEFGVRLADGSQPIRFALIGQGDLGAEPLFEAVPATYGQCEPTAFGIGFVRRD